MKVRSSYVLGLVTCIILLAFFGIYRFKRFSEGLEVRNALAVGAIMSGPESPDDILVKVKALGITDPKYTAILNDTKKSSADKISSIKSLISETTSNAMTTIVNEVNNNKLGLSTIGSVVSSTGLTM